MPYTASTVPKHVPKEKAAQWAAIFNAAMKEHDEETAFRMANAILTKKDFEEGTVAIIPHNIDRSFLGNIKKAVGLAEDPSRAPFVLFKSEGNLRFLCTPTNCFMDRDYDVLTSQAHKDFVAYCNTYKQYPELWLWHVQGTKCGDVDWLEYDDEGFVCASGTIDKDWQEVVLKACEDGNIGMSHGFIAVPGCVDSDGCITKYFSFEYSILPVRNAANVWTAFNVGKGVEPMALSNESKGWLSKLGIPDEQISGFEAANKDTAEKLKASGIKHKDANEEATTEAGGSTVTESVSAPQAPVQSDVSEGFKALANMLTELGTTVSTIGTEVASIKEKQATIEAEVKKSVEDKMEEMYKSKVATQPGGFIATQSKENTTTSEQDSAVRQVTDGNGKPISFLDQVLDHGLKVAGIPVAGGSN